MQNNGECAGSVCCDFGIDSPYWIQTHIWYCLLVQCLRGVQVAVEEWKPACAAADAAACLEYYPQASYFVQMDTVPNVCELQDSQWRVL